MAHWVITYDRAARALVACTPYGDDLGRATLAKLTAELHRRPGSDVEVAVVAASSELELRARHGRYFETCADRAARLVRLRAAAA